MRFGILGSLEVHIGGRVVGIRAHKQRVLLATLISRVGRPTTADLLIDALWGDKTPKAVKKALGWHLLQLRTVLGDTERICFRMGGYVLEAPADDVDAERFQRLYREGMDATASQPEVARRSFMRGLALWRGTAYEDVTDTTMLLHEARRLGELRLDTMERYFDCGLRLGRHGELIPELTALVAENPYRQQFRAQLMLALFRCGRQADALKTYQEGRKVTAAELGLDPGPMLRELEQRILNNDPRLAAPAVADTVVTRAEAAPVPRQLPADLSTFIGRDGEIAALTRIATASKDRPNGGILVTALDGMAGIGKTSLAVHVAHLLAPRYPDGQLFIDLHGYCGDIAPIDPAQALNRLLGALGVTGAQVPAHVEDRAALFRSRLSGKRILLLLDNAANEAQVRPLLPGGPQQLTLITSRRHLLGIDDAFAVNLELLDAEHAVELFCHTSGITEPTTAQLAEIRGVVAVCGGLPLAIRLAAYRLRRNPSWTLGDLRRRLSGQRSPLSALSVGERSVAATLRLSYRELDDAVGRTFRMLSLYPGRRFDGHAVAALSGVDLAAATDHLDELYDANLLEDRGGNRYGFHDLVRQYAAQESQTAGDDRRGALVRLLDGFRRTAYDITMLIDPHLKHFPTVPPRPCFPIPGFDTVAEAVAWYDAESVALHNAVTLAVEAGLDTHAWELAHAVDALDHFRGNLVAGLAMNRAALVAARRIADKRILSYALNNVANSHRILSEFDAAIREYGEALDLRRDLQDLRGQAAVLNNLGIAYRRVGDLTAAAAGYESAIELAQKAGSEPLEALAISNFAGVCDHLGQWDRGLEFLNRAREICLRLGHDRQLARIDHWFGVAHVNLGDPKLALEYHRRSLAYSEHVDEVFGVSEIVNSIAVALRALGRHAEALLQHRRALDISQDLGDIALHAGNLTDFGRTLLDAGQVAAAVDAFETSTAKAAEVDARFEMARAAHAMADALTATGDRFGARRHLDTAIAIFTEMGVPLAKSLRKRRDG